MEIKKFLKQFIKEIKAHENILIFHHIRPDGDCLGSQHGLKKWIEFKFPNKKVYAIGNNEKVLDFMNFEFQNIPSDEILRNSLGIVVDANYSNRIKHNEIIIKNKLKTLIRIDHHPEEDDINYKLRFVDPSYCSSTEQISHLIYLNSNKKICPKIAEFLYLGMYTDSGRFFYDYTSSRTHFLTSWLFNSGFDFYNLHQKLAKRTLKEIEFSQYVFNNYQTFENVIYCFIPFKEMQRLKISEHESNRVDFLANIEGYDIWIFFIENEDGTIRVRLRSTQKDISILARQYKGGGHKKAAGAIINNQEDISIIVEKAANLK